LLAASVIQDQGALATPVLEAVFTLGLGAGPIPGQVVGHLLPPVVAPIRVQAAAHPPRQVVDCIQVPAVVLTLDRVVGPIRAQEVEHLQRLVEGVTPGLVGLQQISGTARHLIASRSMACSPAQQVALQIF
jgi:hypothetical protein